jgi:periplasmic protein TonB
VSAKEFTPMKIHESSRRQDLLAGSLVPTVIVCLVVFLDHGHMFQGLSTLRPVTAPPPKPFVLPPDPVDLTDATDPVKTQPVVAPVPQIPDSPQPIRADSITQPIEPPVPDGHLTTTVTIPNNWGANGRAPFVFDPSVLDQPPVAGVQAKPAYPFAMKQQGLSGSVLVDFIVDSEGNVRNATAVKSTNSEFAASAVLAVAKWKFRPGRKAGHAVFTHLQVPIEFTLSDSGQ